MRYFSLHWLHEGPPPLTLHSPPEALPCIPPPTEVQIMGSQDRAFLVPAPQLHNSFLFLRSRSPLLRGQQKRFSFSDASLSLHQIVLGCFFFWADNPTIAILLLNYIAIVVSIKHGKAPWWLLKEIQHNWWVDRITQNNNAYSTLVGSHTALLESLQSTLQGRPVFSILQRRKMPSLTLWQTQDPPKKTSSCPFSCIQLSHHTSDPRRAYINCTSR